MNKIIRTLLLFIIFVIAVTTYRVAIARDVINCEEYVYIKDYAECVVTQKWGYDEWLAFDWIIQKESSWNYKAQNTKSSAFGLGQFLDSTWETVGYEKSSDPRIQILATIEYLDLRYQLPSKARKFHLINNFY